MGVIPRPALKSAAPAASGTGCISIGEAPLGPVVRIRGDITSVVLRPTTSTRALEAEIDDGAERLVIVWLGRTAIRGVEPGRAITIEGRVVRMDDRFMMFNPKYELAPRGVVE